VTCRELYEFICEYLEGNLPEDQHAQFKAHLSNCPCCEQYLVSYRQTIRAAKSCLCDKSSKDAPPPMPDDLINAILAARKTHG